MGFWIVWFVIGIVFVVAYAAFLLPRLILKARSDGFPLCGKAVKKERGSDFEAVVYEPSASARPYFRRYRVYRSKRGLFFRGEWAKHVAYIRYEIGVFNANDDLIDVIAIKEKFNSGCNTAEVRLPKKTDMISLRVVCVDDKPLPSERLRLNIPYCIWTAAICASLAVMVDLLLWMTVTFVFGCLDGFTSALSLPLSDWGAFLGLTAAGTAVFAFLFTAVRHLLLNNRRRGE